jgi:GNAT superfamily N-acetyltransferase
MAISRREGTGFACDQGPRCSRHPSAAARADASLTPPEVEDLYNLYRGEWWSGGREPAEIRSMLAHSDLLFAVTATASGRLIGFARVLTDWVFKAMVFDVIVAREQRAQGIGRLLMRSIVEHPRLATVRHLELYCLPELIPFYKRWGFATDFSGVCLLRRQGARSATRRAGADQAQR